MDSPGEKNKAFLKWLKSLPTDKRKETLQKIVSGGVLNGTSAKAALFKLQRQCYVKVPKVDMVKAMTMACTSARETVALPSCPSPPPSCSAPSPPPSAPRQRRSVPAGCRPCPLSRKRPRVAEKADDTKRPRRDSGVCSPTRSPTPAGIEETAAAVETASVGSASSKDQAPCATPSEPAATPCTQSSSVQSPDIPQPTHTKASSQPSEKSSPAVPPQPREPQSTVVPPLEEPSQLSNKPLRSSWLPKSAEPSKPPTEPSGRITLSDVLQSSQTAPRQRLDISLRVVEQTLTDVARSIYEAEMELKNLDQKLNSFEKLPPSQKTNSTMSTLIESLTLIAVKAGTIRSCIENGVSDRLGLSFYPKLLLEVQKISQLKLYSMLRLSTIVNILFDLTKPNCDPKYTVNSLIAKALTEWRPAASTKSDAQPQTQQLKPNPPSDRVRATQVQVPSVSQTSTHVAANNGVIMSRVGSAEAAPRQPQHVQAQPRQYSRQQEQQPPKQDLSQTLQQPSHAETLPRVSVAPRQVNVAPQRVSSAPQQANVGSQQVRAPPAYSGTAAHYQMAFHSASNQSGSSPGVAAQNLQQAGAVNFTHAQGALVNQQAVQVPGQMYPGPNLVAQSTHVVAAVYSSNQQVYPSSTAHPNAYAASGYSLVHAYQQAQNYSQAVSHHQQAADQQQQQAQLLLQQRLQQERIQQDRIRQERIQQQRIQQQRIQQQQPQQQQQSQPHQQMVQQYQPQQQQQSQPHQQMLQQQQLHDHQKLQQQQQLHAQQKQQQIIQQQVTHVQAQQHFHPQQQFTSVNYAAPTDQATQLYYSSDNHEFVAQASPARTLSRDSGIATPDSPSYEDPNRGGTSSHGWKNRYV